jgi:hypothetical protein
MIGQVIKVDPFAPWLTETSPDSKQRQQQEQCILTSVLSKTPHTAQNTSFSCTSP